MTHHFGRKEQNLENPFFTSRCLSLKAEYCPFHLHKTSRFYLHCVFPIRMRTLTGNCQLKSSSLYNSVSKFIISCDNDLILFRFVTSRIRFVFIKSRSVRMSYSKKKKEKLRKTRPWIRQKNHDLYLFRIWCSLQLLHYSCIQLIQFISFWKFIIKCMVLQ